MERIEKSICFITEKTGDEKYNFHKKTWFLNLSNFIYILFFLTCLILAVSFFSVYPGNINHAASSNQELRQTEFFVRPNMSREKCDLFKGQWIPDERGSLYSNDTCGTIPADRNCLHYGRENKEFLNYRWKPDECELPCFDPEVFLDIVKGKTMAFIGDSLARNQMSSLLCLLSSAETPTLVYKDDEERVATWKFSKHNFMLRVLWAKYLIAHTERIRNNDADMYSFDLHLDKVDTNWFDILPSLDYVVVTNGLWYFLQNYLYENGSLVGCNYCGAENVATLGHEVALRKAFRTVFKEINNCKTCRNLRILGVTHNPVHFENGGWLTGGTCTRTKPYRPEEVPNWGDLFFRDLLVEEIDIAKNEGKENENILFDIIDITGMMILRPDGHPGENHGKYLFDGGKRDCSHWCLPGPIDTWNQLLLEMLIRSST